MLKVLLWIIVSIVGLLAIAFLLLQLSPVQNYIAGKAENWIEKKAGNVIDIGSIDIDFPTSVDLTDVYVEDQQGDTLWYSRRLKADINMWGLIRGKISLGELAAERVTLHLERTLPDSAFNFQFLADAFSSGKPKPVKEGDTAAAPPDIHIGELNLNDVYLTFRDEVTGMYLSNRVGVLMLDMRSIDLAEMDFKAKSLSLQNTKAYYEQFKPAPPAEDEEEAAPMQLKLNELLLGNVEFTYADKVGGARIEINVYESRLSNGTLNTGTEKVSIDEYSLTNSYIGFITGRYITADSVVKQTSKTLVEEDPAGAETAWTIDLKRLRLENDSFRMIGYNTPDVEGIDMNHLVIGSINTEIKNIHYGPDSTLADLKSLSLRSKEGFKVQSLQTDFSMSKEMATLENLELVTGNSRIAHSIRIDFEHPDSIGENLANLGINAELRNTHVGVRDVLYFAPKLANKKPFAGNENMRIAVNGNIKGKVSDLRIDDLRLSARQSIALHIDGRIQGLPEAEKAYYDIQLKKLTVSESDLYALIPAGTIPDSLDLPSRMMVVGSFRGTLDDFQSRADINTTMGDAVAEVVMQPAGKESVYKADIDVASFDLGDFLNKPDLIGTVSANASIDGRGLSMETMDANVQALMRELTFKDYTYTDLAIKGRIQNQAFTGRANMTGEDLAFTYDGTVSFDTANPYYDFVLDLREADLQQLNLAEKDLHLKGKLAMDIKGSTLNDINGDLGISEVLIRKDERSFYVQELLFASIQDKRRTEITVESDFFSGFFRGNINIGDFPTVMRKHLDRYFYMPKDSAKLAAKGKDEENLRPQNFEFQLDLHKPEILTEVLVPDLEEFIPGTIKGSYNSEQHNINMQISMPRIVYSGIAIDSMHTVINSNADRLNYNINFNQVAFSDFTIENTSVSGFAENDSVFTNLLVKDSADRDKFLLYAVVGREPSDAYKLTIMPEGAIFNYEPWSVNEGAYLKLGKNGLYAHEFAFTNGGRMVKADSKGSEDERSPVVLSFRTFPLSAFSSLIEAKEPLIRGLVNGEVTLTGDTNMAFTADVQVLNFSYKGDTLGDIAADVHQEGRGRYVADARITGSGNSVFVNGYYSTATPKPSYSFDVDINNLRLASLQGYLSDQLTNLQGTLRGELQVQGNTVNPDIIGHVDIESARFKVNALNSAFVIADESIRFSKDGVHISSFTIIDSTNNRATISGSVYTKYFEEFSLDLDLRARNFQVMNTSEDADQVYYGQGVVSTDLQITGDAFAPVIQGSVTIEENSNLSFELPYDETKAVSRHGIVEFIDQDSTFQDELYAEESDTVAVELKGIAMDLNIEVDEDAILNVVIDPIAGDYLQVQGSAALSFGMDRDGKMTLTGRYDLTDGSYLFTFANFLKREFKIKPGSSITWFGDPLDARLDIAATYTVKAAPLELVERQLAGVDESQRLRYREEIPFNVNLAVTGELKQPEIELGLSLPSDAGGDRRGVVTNRITQLEANESEMNKQVFALLVLGRFLPEDPLDAPESGGNLSSAVASSVSEMLSTQLNRLAGEYFEGTEINFDLETYDDYSSGQATNRTDLGINLTQQLLNERLEVSVGGDVNIRGDVPGDDNVSNIIGDVSVEYKLTKDGRLRGVIFRQDDYEGIIAQQIIETGIGLIFTRDYNKLKELFSKPKDTDLEDED